MRRWLVALAALALLAALGLAIALHRVDALLAARADEIAKRAAGALGREVEFSEIGVSLRHGLGIRVEGLRVGDDPAFSGEPFLRADLVEARVPLRSVLSGRPEVDRVVLHAPEIRVIRSAQGLSTASLGGVPATAPGADAALPPAPEAAAALLAVGVEIRDATIRYVDRSSLPAVEHLATQVDWLASDVASGAPIGFEMAAATLGSAEQNLRAKGTLELAAEPILDLSLELDPLELALAARLERGRVEVSRLSLALFGGTLAATGSADLGADGAPALDARLELRGASVEEILASRGAELPTRVTGRLDAQLALRGAGASWDAIAPTLVGGGEVGVFDGVLRGVNPAADALETLMGMPLLRERRLRRLRDERPEVFRAEDSPFERIEARVEVAGGEIFLHDARVHTGAYDVTGIVRYAFAGEYESEAVMAFSRELSDALVDADKKLKLLRSREDRVELPVRVRGEPGEVEVRPDVALIARTISRESLDGVVGGDLLRDGLDRLLRGKH